MTRNRKLLLVSLLYFAEGFPYGILELAFPIYFRTHGMSLQDVGLFAGLVALPYALKVLWAPAVDFLGTRRRWIASAQFLMAAAMLILMPQDPKDPSFILWASLAAMAILSATQDVAIDAYSIEMLKVSEMGIANGYRQAAYRVAMLVAGGLLVAMGGWVSWYATFTAAAVILGICAVVSLKLPAIEVQRPPFSPATLIAPIRDIFSRPGFVLVACFILLYKLGDLSMGPMVRPFWVDKGLTAAQMGLITGTLGITASIAGAMAGGVFMARFGIFHGLWFLGLWQSVSNLGYAWVAASPGAGHWEIYAASAVESFCGGLGSAAFLAFLMSICRKEFSATQYALFSSLFRSTGILAGAFSGLATDKMGYAPYFVLTFFLSLPAFFFIFKARNWIPVNGNGHDHEPLPANREPEEGPAIRATHDYEAGDEPAGRSRDPAQSHGGKHAAA